MEEVQTLKITESRSHVRIPDTEMCCHHHRLHFSCGLIYVFNCNVLCSLTCPKTELIVSVLNKLLSFGLQSIFSSTYALWSYLLSACRKRWNVGGVRSWSSVWTEPERAACCRVWPPASRRRREDAAGPPAASTSWASTCRTASWTSWRVRRLSFLLSRGCLSFIRSHEVERDFYPCVPDNWPNDLFPIAIKCL